jgi:putative ABC transport system permease protein
VTRFLKPMLYDLKAHDRLTMIAIAALLALLAVAACYLPAKRAVGVQAMEALRHP